MIVRRILHALGTIAFFWRNPIRGLGLLYEDSKLMQKQKYDNFPVVKLEEITNGYYPVVSPVSFQTGGSGITDYVLIKSICSQYDQLDYLEIGTFKGESVQNILELDNLHRAVSITLPPDHPKIQKIENVRECEGIFIDQSNKKFTQIYADSLLYDYKTLGDKFDVVFIDGDHSYEGIYNDTKKVLPLLKNDESVIIWHDYAKQNEIVVPASVNAIADAIPKHLHKHLYYIENTICAIFTKKEVISEVYSNGFHIPTHYFSVSIAQHKI